jgi:WD40-like Beta Propeller Repeat
LVASTPSIDTRELGTRQRIGRGIVLAAVLFAGLVAIVIWQFIPYAGSMLPPARVMVLTSYPGIEARPTFSPDGKQVAPHGTARPRTIRILLTNATRDLPRSKADTTWDDVEDDDQ